MSNIEIMKPYAYKKSLNETTENLETMNLQATALKSTIASHENTIEMLKGQIKFLEENLDSEPQHPIGEGKGKDSSEEMKNFLSMHQKAMTFVIETVNKDMKSLKIITEGMNQMV